MWNVWNLYSKWYRLGLIITNIAFYKLLSNHKIRQFFNMIRWVACLINQASDVPNIIFFITSSKIICKKPFNLFFYNFTKMKIKSFECPKSKPATHCTVLLSIYWDNAWPIRHCTCLMRQRTQLPSVLYWKLSAFMFKKRYRRRTLPRGLWC